jgi:hypothetical protein
LLPVPLLDPATQRSVNEKNSMDLSDVIQVARLDINYIKAFDVHPEPSHDDDWTEEDDADLERIVKEIEAELRGGC